MDIKDFRKELDTIDDKIAELYAERFEVVRKIGLWKKSNSVRTNHSDREKAIVDRLAPRFDEGLRPYIATLYARIFEDSKDYQDRLKGDYYVIGRSLPHTWSPDIYIPMGLDYRVKELKDEEEVKRFVLSKNYSGFNATIPYKFTVMQCLDEISEEAKAIGSVNTVVNRNGKLYGYNTDIGGMAYAISAAGIKLSGKTVAILGTGGTSVTAEFLSHREGAREVLKVSRTGELNYNNIYERADIEIIINTTPVGMFPHAEECPVDINKFPRLEGVFDAVYNPIRTLLVSEARRNGIAASGGLPMLVEQGRLAYNLYTDTETDLSVTASLVKRIENAKSNIVLIGMPSVGKTTIAKRLKELTGREYYDSDEVVEHNAGMSVPEIFARYGEEYFRAEEEKAIAELSGMNGVIIATGGGAPMRDINRLRLKRNGVVVLIARDNASLIDDGRPVSKREGIAALYKKRMPIYNEYKDITVDNDASVDETAAKIISALHIKRYIKR